MAVHLEALAFVTDGITLSGHLRTPTTPAPDGGYPALAVTGPFTGVKEQVAGDYAERLTEAGFVTLAFDHRGFGASGGRRAHEDTQGKLTDLRAAVTTLAAHPAVDPHRIGLTGICLGGGYAVRAAAQDPRVRAVAGIAGGYNSPRFFAADPDGYHAGLAGFIARYDEFMPAVAPDGGEAAMSGEEPWSYYGTARSAAETWENRVTRGSLHSLLTFDALSAAPLLSRTPLLVVHGKVDAYCSPDLAAQLYDQATGPKHLEWLDCDLHVDLYDNEPYVTQAATAAATFFKEHLQT
ncbi:alpha/beta hydrolase [Dactylosporangium sp. NPDC051541]|uniref:alpha/beta hydrolase n=1 Tax=Dactylosporangium sp. NPDC051541 TaxID=3363977 RepID=UPI0037AC25F5